VALGGATTLLANGGSPISFGSTINGAQDLVIATTGNVDLGTGIGGTTPLSNLTVAGDLPSPSPSTFPDFTQIPNVGTLDMTSITASSQTTGTVILSANSFTGSGTVTTGFPA
jgi:hypothetical protein